MTLFWWKPDRASAYGVNVEGQSIVHKVSPAFLLAVLQSLLFFAEMNFLPLSAVMRFDHFLF